MAGKCFSFSLTLISLSSFHFHAVAMQLVFLFVDNSRQTNPFENFLSHKNELRRRTTEFLRSGIKLKGFFFSSKNFARQKFQRFPLNRCTREEESVIERERTATTTTINEITKANQFIQFTFHKRNANRTSS